MRSHYGCRTRIRRSEGSNLSELWGADVASMDANTYTFQGGWMGEQGEVKRRIHSMRYIRQMLEWGFDKEFIARDMGVELSSLETRLRRAKVREQNEVRNS
jgi:hypothetical protein